jgi:uncharacterized membrane protein
MEFDKKLTGKLILIISFIFLLLLISIKVSFDEQEVFMCELVSLNPEINMSECPAHNPVHSWLLTLSFILIGISTIFGLVLLFPKNNKKQFKQINKGKLTEEELIIYNHLVSKEGSDYQSNLINLGFSKVKVTRILDGLEQKEIIERKRRGMTNLIVLK